MTDIEVVGRDYKLLSPQIENFVHHFFRGHNVYSDEREKKVLDACRKELIKNESLCKKLLDKPRMIELYVEQTILYLL